MSFPTEPSSRPLWVVGAFVRDSLIWHVRLHLKPLALLATRDAAINHPLPEELSLRVRESANEEAKRSAEEKARSREETRRIVADSLKHALGDIKSVEEVLAKHKGVLARIIGPTLKLLQRISPIAVFSAFTAWMESLRELPVVTGILVCAGWILAYHLFALLGVPFHDADYRKYLLLEGYMPTTTDDGIPAMPGKVSQQEQALFGQLGVKPPIVVSWEVLVPLVHYSLTILMVVLSIAFLPLGLTGLVVALCLGASIVYWQWQHIRTWREWIRHRYPNQTLIELFLSPLL